MGTKAIAAIAFLLTGASLYQASEWWEKAFATYESSEMSPDGCIRVDTYNAFRVLPSPFHRIPHPDPAMRHGFGMRWDGAIFDRAYEVSTGIMLGETVVFDPTVSFGLMNWGDTHTPGRRIITDGGFALAETTRCSDKATLAKLDAYYSGRRQIARDADDALRLEQDKVLPRERPNL